MKKKTELIPNPPSLAAEIAAMTTEQLREELVRGLRVSADNLLRLALIVQSLESRGEQVSALKMGILPYLRQIASGRLLPEIVVRFAGVPALIAKMGRLPLEEQKKFASGDPVQVLAKAQDGTLKTKLKDPLSLTVHEIVRVFGDDGVRGEEEQRELANKKSRRSTGERSSSYEEKRSKEARVYKDSLQEAFTIAASMSAGDLAERLADVVAKHSDHALVLAKLEAEVVKRVEAAKQGRLLGIDT